MSVAFEAGQVPLQVGISVRVAVSKVDDVVVVFELDTEGKRVKVASRFSLDGVLIVANIFPRPLPSCALELSRLVRVHERLHAVVVKAVGLEQVYNVKSVRPPRPGSLQAEVEPLAVQLRLVVRAQDKVIFEFVNLDSSSQVA